jgi:ectoine hydroxylase-related dioxygenase (phytanoyl-CoA dioxygenase family)
MKLIDDVGMSGKTITPAHVEAYRRDGTVLIPGAFIDWVESLSAAIMSVIERHRRHELAEAVPGSFQNPIRVWEAFGGGTLAQNLVPYDPRFSDWLRRSPAAEMAANIMASSGVRYWIDASFVKSEDGAAEGTPWHNDTCTWPFWGEQMAILWIALTDVGPDDSPLTTVRASHHGDGRYYSTFFPPVQEIPAPYKPWQELLDQVTAPDSEVLTWTMARGDCLFMHPSTVHASLPRRAERVSPRLSFSTRWLGDDVVFKPDPLTAQMTDAINGHPGMQYGRPPADDAIPVTWQRTADSATT